MKPIQFTNQTAQKLYSDYITRIKRTTQSLDKKDQEEILMELNSHIYEGLLQLDHKNEIENLVNLLDKLGAPEEVLKPLVAQKKLEQATKTFNPKHIFKALTLNLSNGVLYIVFAFLYLTLFGFVYLIIAKILHPNQVGLFFKEGKFHLLGIRNSHQVKTLELTEVLGNWFIPTMLFIIVVLYILITLLLRMKRKK